MNKFAIAAILMVSSALIPSAQAEGSGRVYPEGAPPATPQTCEQLAQLALPNTKITTAQTVAAGAFAPPANMTPWLAGDPNFYKGLPSFCRVTATSKPTADSDIKIEVWLPTTGWNGKFRGQGNGGFAGEIDYHLLGLAVLQGYASAATDTGHAAEGGDATWALGHPEKIVDFAYRAIHEMTTVGKATVKAFYGDAAQHSYFANCSNGGRQALMEAQRYPGRLRWNPGRRARELLDAPAGCRSVECAIHNTRSGQLHSGEQNSSYRQGRQRVCDAKDGVTDGVLNDPRQCHFDPAALLCKAADSDACLTQPQVTALKKLYQGPRDAKGQQIFPGYVPGGEEGGGGWALWITGPAPGKSLTFVFGGGFFSDMVYEKPDWDYKKANLDESVAAADKKFATVLNATGTNLKPFESRGGKLIIYHGWNDSGISPLNTHQLLRGRREQNGQARCRFFHAPLHGAGHAALRRRSRPRCFWRGGI